MGKTTDQAISSADVEFILQALEHHLRDANGGHNGVAIGRDALDGVMKSWWNNGKSSQRRNHNEIRDSRVDNLRATSVLIARRLEYARALVRTVETDPREKVSEAFQKYRKARSAHDGFSEDFLKDSEIRDLRQCLDKAAEVSEALDRAIEWLCEGEVRSWSDLLELAEAAETEHNDLGALIGTRSARLFAALIQGIRTLAAKDA